MSKLIAIIDDNDAVQDSLRDLVESAGFEVRCFGSAKSFLDSGTHREAAALIIDIRMPTMSGLQLQARLKDEECNAPVVVITAFDDVAARTQAMRQGAVEFLVKPFDHQLLIRTLRTNLGM